MSYGRLGSEIFKFPGGTQKSGAISFLLRREVFAHQKPTCDTKQLRRMPLRRTSSCKNVRLLVNASNACSFKGYCSTTASPTNRKRRSPMDPSGIAYCLKDKRTVSLSENIDGLLERLPPVTRLISPKRARKSLRSRPLDFIMVCTTCSKTAMDTGIFMYRDQGFCSDTCRSEAITLDYLGALTVDSPSSSRKPKPSGRRVGTGHVSDAAPGATHQL
ncbi:hypothetical protein AAMO2058_001264200 [Amorphochlora amoebiformis]